MDLWFTLKVHWMNKLPIQVHNRVRLQCSVCTHKYALICTDTNSINKYVHTCNICANTSSTYIIQYKYVLKMHTYNYGQNMHKMQTKIWTICTGGGVNPLLKRGQYLISICSYCKYKVSIWSVLVCTSTFICTVLTNTDQILTLFD